MLDVVRVKSQYSCGSKQYSQQLSARFRTKSRVAASIVNRGRTRYVAWP